MQKRRETDSHRFRCDFVRKKPIRRKALSIVCSAPAVSFGYFLTIYDIITAFKCQECILRSRGELGRSHCVFGKSIPHSDSVHICKFLFFTRTRKIVRGRFFGNCKCYLLNYSRFSVVFRRFSAIFRFIRVIW